MCEGNYVPRKSVGKYFSVDSTEVANKIALAITNNKYPEICINEVCSGENFERVKEIVDNAFERKFPEKSMFEQ